MKLYLGYIFYIILPYDFSNFTVFNPVNKFSCCNSKKMKKQITDWEKIPHKAHLISDCYPKYTKNT